MRLCDTGVISPSGKACGNTGLTTQTAHQQQTTDERGVDIQRQRDCDIFLLAKHLHHRLPFKGQTVKTE